jgi:hypothetical protein
MKYKKEEKTNNCFNLIIPFVTLFAVAALGKKCANPYGPELQVKQMLARRRSCGAKRNKYI